MVKTTWCIAEEIKEDMPKLKKLSTKDNLTTHDMELSSLEHQPLLITSQCSSGLERGFGFKFSCKAYNLLLPKKSRLQAYNKEIRGNWRLS